MKTKSVMTWAELRRLKLSELNHLASLNEADARRLARSVVRELLPDVRVLDTRVRCSVRPLVFDIVVKVRRSDGVTARASVRVLEREPGYSVPSHVNVWLKRTDDKTLGAYCVSPDPDEYDSLEKARAHLEQAFSKH